MAAAIMPAAPPDFRCLSIRQPWAWLITSAGKDVENRKWRTSYRGRLLIHAGNAIDVEAMRALASLRRKVPDPGEILTGGIVGVCDLVDCVDASDSQWFGGPHGLVLANARPLPFVAMPGRLSIFRAPDDMAPAIEAALRGL